MESPIIIRFRWTADVLLQAERDHFSYTCRPVIQRCMNLVAALMILVGCVLIAGGKSYGPGILIFFGVYWLVIRHLWLRWMVRRRIARSPEKNLEMEWQASPDMLCVRNDLGKIELNWQAISKMVSTPRSVLFFPNDQVFYWMPRSGCISEADFEKLVELGKTKVPRYYNVG